MESRISSALIDLGLMSPAEVERARALQAERGGTLDTVLLEEGAVSEATLAALLSRGWGLPPLDPSQFQQLDPEQELPVDPVQLQALHLAPVARYGPTLALALSEGSRIIGVEQLEEALGCRVFPIIGPDVRLHQLRDRMLGVQCPERYATLLGSIGATPPMPAVLAPGPAEDPGGPASPGDRPPRGPALPAEDPGGPASPGDRPPRGPALPDEDCPREGGSEVAAGELLSEPAPEAAGDAAIGLQPVDSVEVAVVPSLAPGQAVEQVRDAEDVEEVLVALARGASHFLAHVQILVRQGDRLAGYLELQGGALDIGEVHARGLPLAPGSALSLAARRGVIFAGALADDDPAAAAVAGVGMPPGAEIVLVPVVVDSQTHCAILGHAAGEPLTTELRACLARLAIEAGVALAGRLTREAGAVTALVRRDAGPRERGEGGARPLSELMETLDRGGPATRADAAQELRDRSRQAIPWLVARFPGESCPLPLDTLDELPPVRECSPVLRALTAIGRPVLHHLPRLLDAPEARVRLYATYLISAIQFPEAIALLSGRLEDEDPAVQRMALRVIKGFCSLEHFPMLREQLVRYLDRPDPRMRKEAVEALGALGDEAIVPRQIDLLADPEPAVAAAAQRSLVRLVRQDFERDAGQWSRWWQRNQHRAREEWVIDGLTHRDPAIRQSAAAEVESWMGEPLPLDVNGPRKQREELRQRCLDWWTFTRWWEDAELGDQQESPRLSGAFRRRQQPEQAELQEADTGRWVAALGRARADAAPPPRSLPPRSSAFILDAGEPEPAAPPEVFDLDDSDEEDALDRATTLELPRRPRGEADRGEERGAEGAPGAAREDGAGPDGDPPR